MIFTLSNNDVIHGVWVHGYFKCRYMYIPIIPILLFDNNTRLKAHSFIFYLLYNHQLSVMKLPKFSCAGFVSPW